MKSSLYKLIHFLSITVIPLLLVVFAVIYKIDWRVYLQLLLEDSVVEWLTFVFLFLSGLLSLFIAIQIRKRTHRYHWFFIAFSLFCILAALEEISWGQRIFGMESPEFFLRNSDVGEINVHNVIKTWYRVKVKYVAGWSLFLYGTCLPMLALNHRIRSLFERIRLVVPPPVLAFSFFIAALIIMFDRPTGEEEEIGELFFSLCFFLFMIMEYLKPEREDTGSSPKSPVKRVA